MAVTIVTKLPDTKLRYVSIDGGKSPIRNTAAVIVT